MIPGEQRLARIVALEIVGGIEQVLPAGLPLSPGEGAQAVEPARDGRDEASFAATVGGHRAENRRGLLVGPVGPAQALYRGSGPPAGLEQEVDPPFAR